MSSEFIFQAPTAEEIAEISERIELKEQQERLLGIFDNLSTSSSLPDMDPLEQVRNELYLKLTDSLERLSGPQWLNIWTVIKTGTHFLKVFKWTKSVMTIEPFFNSMGQLAYRMNSPIMDDHEVKFKLATEKLGSNRITDSVDGVLSAVRWGGHWTPVPRKKKVDKKQVYLAQVAQVIDLRD